MVCINLFVGWSEVGVWVYLFRYVDTRGVGGVCYGWCRYCAICLFGFVYVVLFQWVFNHGGDICFGFFGVSLIDVV